jgi:hypothetical protein
VWRRAEVTILPGLPPAGRGLCEIFDDSPTADRHGGTGNLDEVKDASGKFAKALNLPKAMLEQ